MDAKLLKVILDDETLTDEQIAVLLVKAQKQAANQHFWRMMIFRQRQSWRGFITGMSLKSMIWQKP